MKYMVRNLRNLLRKVILMLIPRKEKELLEIYKCKLGIHKWVHEFWYEYRMKPRKARFSKKGDVSRRPSIIPNIVRGFIVKDVVRNERIDMRTKK